MKRQAGASYIGPNLPTSLTVSCRAVQEVPSRGAGALAGGEHAALLRCGGARGGQPGHCGRGHPQRAGAPHTGLLTASRTQSKCHNCRACSLGCLCLDCEVKQHLHPCILAYSIGTMLKHSCEGQPSGSPGLTAARWHGHGRGVQVCTDAGEHQLPGLICWFSCLKKYLITALAPCSCAAPRITMPHTGAALPGG